MLKKAARDFFIVFGLVLLWASTSRDAMEFLSDNRSGNNWWSVYRAPGNLLQLSRLDFVKRFNDEKHVAAKHYKPGTGPRNTALTVYGDSYTYPLNDSDFTGLAHYSFVNLYQGGKYSIDATKKNILILEMAELSFRSFFADAGLIIKLQDAALAMGSTGSADLVEPCGNMQASLDLHIGSFFNSRINQNLQYNLFSYKSTYYLFLCKAALNYHLFKRASGDVVISDNGDYLLLKEALKITHDSVSPADLTALVDNINRFYDHFKRAGFYEVYLSVIPATSTIIQPAGYNMLIPMVQQDGRLRMKIIDVYSAFKVEQGYFCHGDSHWSQAGEKKWLNMVDEVIAKNNKN